MLKVISGLAVVSLAVLASAQDPSPDNLLRPPAKRPPASGPATAPATQTAPAYLAEMLFRDHVTDRFVYGRQVLYPGPAEPAEGTPVICFDEAGNPVPTTDPNRTTLLPILGDGAEARPGTTREYGVSRDTTDITRAALRAGDMGTYTPLPTGREPVFISWGGCIYRIQVVDPAQDPRRLELTVNRELYRQRCTELREEFLRLEAERLSKDPRYLSRAQQLLRDPRLLTQLREGIAKMRRMEQDDPLGNAWRDPWVIDALCRTGDVSDVSLLREWMRQHPKIAEVVCREAPPMARRLGIAPVRPLLIDLLDNETEPVGSAYDLKELIRLDPGTCVPQIRDRFVHAMTQAFDLDPARFSIVHPRLRYLQLTGGKADNEADFRKAGDVINTSTWIFPHPDARTAGIERMRRWINDLAREGQR